MSTASACRRALSHALVRHEILAELDQAHLWQTALVSKSWGTSSQAVMYCRPVLSNLRAEQGPEQRDLVLLRTLADRPDLAARVKHITMTDMPNVQWAKYFKLLRRLCKNATAVTLIGEISGLPFIAQCESPADAGRHCRPRQVQR